MKTSPPTSKPAETSIPADQLSPNVLLQRLGNASCDILATNTAKDLSDQRIYQLLPQLIDSKGGFTKLADYDCDGVVEGFELRAALIGAAQIARARHIKLEDVNLSDISAANAQLISRELIGENASMCKPKRPDR